MKKYKETIINTRALPKVFDNGIPGPIDKDGFLYISVEERGNEKENLQNFFNALGKIHRIKDDGNIPPDIPFVEVAGAVASVYSYGHRNPLGLTLHPVTGQVWANEHGPRGGVEINFVRKGKNFG